MLGFENGWNYVLKTARAAGYPGTDDEIARSIARLLKENPYEPKVKEDTGEDEDKVVKALAI